jgi:hypothetical protein
MTSSGVVPAQTPRSASPAALASSTSRPTRAAGHRSTPRQPRVHTGKRPVPRTSNRTHGRSRGSSIASCRRSTITVRRSCNVAANRSCPTSVDRRSAASTDRFPARASPTTTTASDTPIATSPHVLNASGHRPMRPHAVSGEALITPSPSATAGAPSPTLTNVPSHDGSRPADAHNAAP